jgi:hypothetical protein
VSPRRYHAKNLKAWQKTALIVIVLIVALHRCALAQTSGDEIVAVLEKQVITARDLNYFAAELRIYEPDLLGAPLSDVRRVVFHEAVEEYLLWRWADTVLKPPSPESVEAWSRETMERYEKAAGGVYRLEDVLEQSGIDRNAFAKWLQEAAKRRLMIREAILLYSQAGAEMPAGNVSEATRIRLAHIFIRKELGTGSDAARKMILRVRRDIEAGISFAEAARLHSEDEFSAMTGGDLGWLNRDQVSPEIWNAIKDMKIGEVSAPTETESGFHILQVVDVVTPAQQEYLRALNEEEMKRIAELRRETDIRVAEGYALEPLPTPTPSPSPEAQ